MDNDIVVYKRTEMTNHEESKTSGDLVLGLGHDVPAFLRKGLFFGLFKNEDEKKVYNSPLCEVSDILNRRGVPSLQLREGLLAVTAFISSRLGHPTYLAVTEDEGATGRELLNLCRRVTPANAVVEFLDIPDISSHSLKDKTIFLPDCQGKDKKLRTLSALLSNQKVFFQDLNKGKRDGGPAHEIEGPTGLVAFIKDMNAEILSLPFIFHIHLTLPNALNVERAIQEEMQAHSSSFELEFNYLNFKALLTRLKPQEVKIPFFKQMVDSLSGKIFNRLDVIRFLKNTLKVITIINHFAPVSKEEIVSKFLSYWTGEELEPTKYLMSSRVVPQNHLLQRVQIANPYDFYCLKCLTEGLPLGGEQITGRSLRVFESIKKINLTYMEPFFAKLDEVLDTLEHPEHTKGWPSIQQILHEVNVGQEEKFGMSTLNKEIQFLLEHDFIKRRQVSKNPVKYVFAVQTLSPGSSVVKLPNPKDLYDSALEGPIVGRNPLTGAIEEI